MLVALLAPLAKTGIVVVFTGFMLVKREDLRNRLIRLIGERRFIARRWHWTTPHNASADTWWPNR